MGFDSQKRSNDIWLLASSNGDNAYKSMVQQADLRFPITNKEGKVQTISFSQLPNQPVGTKSLNLTAVSDSRLPVSYYVKEGPALIDGTKLVFTTLPPRTKLPMKVTVVAWQYGTSVGNKVQSASPVENTFFITAK